MRNWLEKITPPSWLVKKALMVAVLVVVGAAAFCWGRRQSVSADGPRNPYGVPGTPGADIKDYEKRPVAYIHGNQVVTRAELGEYLIARFGAERLQFMVNRKIVDMACQKEGITVTNDEVEYRFRQDLGALGASDKMFVDNILRRFGKTLYEWKEDVIRPKLMMEKLVQASVKVGKNDIEEGFEARYGPKVDCRMIVVQPGNTAVVRQVWEDARKGRISFLEQAGKQFIPNLAKDGGKVPAIHKHFGDKSLEDAAFRLKVGEVSDPIKMPDETYVILLCEAHVPPDTTKKIEEERFKIQKEMEQLRLAQKIPEVFALLQKQANPQLLLDGAVKTATSMTSVQQQQQPMQPMMDLPQAPMPAARSPMDMPPPPVARPIAPPPATGIGLTQKLPELPLAAPIDLTPPAKK